MFVSLLIVVFLCQPLGGSAADDPIFNRPGAFVVSKNKGHMNIRNSIRDVVNHPSFKGFGQFILPLDNRAYEESMQLRHVGSLLPYHSPVEPGAVVDTIHYMIDRVAEGKMIFYNFYTEGRVSATSRESASRIGRLHRQTRDISHRRYHPTGRSRSAFSESIPLAISGKWGKLG